MVPMVHCRVLLVVALLSMPIGSFESTAFAQAQNLEADLLSVSPVELAANSRELGDATRVRYFSFNQQWHAASAT